MGWSHGSGSSSGRTRAGSVTFSVGFAIRVLPGNRAGGFIIRLIVRHKMENIVGRYVLKTAIILFLIWTFLMAGGFDYLRGRSPKAYQCWKCNSVVSQNDEDGKCNKCGVVI